jgi:hypothetical protein
MERGYIRMVAEPVSDAMVRTRFMTMRDGGQRFVEEVCAVATVYRPIYPGAPHVELAPRVLIDTLDDVSYLVRIRVHDPRMTDEELAESVRNVREAVESHAPCHLKFTVEGSNA